MSTSEKSTGDERIRNLEVRLSYQDKMLSELDDVVQGFSIRVERLERKLSDLRESMNSQEIGPGDDQPPHY
ncbi:MAG: SlyX family protein [Kofleriaceae bacterium]|nr:SlyX family protein [Kofleriaceae bacterium]